MIAFARMSTPDTRRASRRPLARSRAAWSCRAAAPPPSNECGRGRHSPTLTGCPARRLHRPPRRCKRGTHRPETRSATHGGASCAPAIVGGPVKRSAVTAGGELVPLRGIL
eukprot:4966309-Prymnesium_polylepis.2